MNNLFDALEKCLQAIEHGADLESALSRYPDLADELRPLLEASFQARGMAVSEPAPEVLRRGRAKLLQRAAEMREAKVPAPRRMIPAFQRLAISLTLTAVFLLSGNGLVRASTTALPGENLYPVKRTWEGMRLLFVFDENLRENLEIEFESERLHEVSELLTEGRDETIQFAGIWLDVNGVYYASGIRVVVLDTTKLPQDALQNGAAVIVTGHTNAAGFVEAEEIELLPAGTTVPMGQPVEVEEAETEDHGTSNSGSNTNDQNDNSDVNSNDDNGNGNENSNDDSGNDNGNENSNDNSGDQGSDNSNDNGNDDSNDNKDNNDNGNEDNSGHGSGDDNSGGEEDSGGGSGGGGED